MNKDLRLRKMIITAILIAFCFIATWIKVPMPTPTGGGLMHLGGVILMISAIFLGPLVGGLVGAVGMGFFDLINYPSYLICTIVVRFFMGFIIGTITKKNNSNVSILIALVVGSLFMMAGYYLYEAIFLAENFISPLISLVGDGISSVISIILVFALNPFFKRIFVKFDKRRVE